ncbi:DUF1176 domain-containing protein [Novilysobacter antarcticus]|uniref:DUF1176 domain-containing protein n=1 Tax=Novilysobacter antarcticus TaxID=2862543 RepID=UPI003CCD4F07
MKPSQVTTIHGALAAAFLCAVAPLANAAEPGIEFSHDDWTLACDNTRTCRAAGYQSEQGGAPMSVLRIAPLVATRAGDAALA